MSQQMTLLSLVVSSIKRGMGTLIWEQFFLQDWQWVFGERKITDMEGALKDDEDGPKEEGCSR